MSDAADEAGQQLRQTTIQGLQTAMMIAQYLRTISADRRATAEHDARQARTENLEAREAELHALKRDGYRQRSIEHDLRTHEVRERMRRADADLDRRAHAEAARQAREDAIHALKTRGYDTRADHDTAKHELEKLEITRRIDRGDRDLERRTRLDTARDTRDTDLHDLRKQAHTRREQRADELHHLDRQERRQRMAIRARAAGFSEQLAQTGADTDHLAATIAGYAAATATADLGPHQQHAADAWAQRLRQSGLDPDDITAAAATGIDEADDDTGDGDPVGDTEPGPPEPSDPAEPDTDPTDPIIGRIADLTARAFDNAQADRRPEPHPGAATAAAIARAGITHPGPAPNTYDQPTADQGQRPSAPETTAEAEPEFS